jgi:hypothetical protein
LLSPEAAAKVPQLLNAAKREDPAALTALLAEADPPPLDAQDPDTLRTPLMEAAAAGHVVTAEWWLERGVKVKLKDWEGRTALMLGAGRGAVLVVRLLLGRTQNINAKDYSGRTALMHAAAGNHRKVVKTLLAGGANRDAVCDEGKTAEDLTTWPAIKGLLRVSWPLAPERLLCGAARTDAPYSAVPRPVPLTAPAPLPVGAPPDPSPPPDVPEAADTGVKEDRRQEKLDRAAAMAEEARRLMGPQAAAKVPQLLGAASRGDVTLLTALLSGPDSPPLETLRTPAVNGGRRHRA